MLTQQKKLIHDTLLKFDFIKQVILFESNSDFFAIVSLISKSFKENCIKEINKLYPFLELIFLDYLLVDENGKIATEILLSKIFIEKNQVILNQVQKKLPTLKGAALERTINITPEYFQQIPQSKKQKRTLIFEQTTATSDVSSYVRGSATAEKMIRPRNLITALMTTANDFADKGVTYINEQGAARFVSYSDLFLRAQKIASYFKDHGIKKGDGLILVCEEHDVFFECLWGALLIQAVPVSITLPINLANINAGAEKFYNTWKLLNKPRVVTTQNKRYDFASLLALFNDLALELFFYEEAINKREVAINEDSFASIVESSSAFYQLTSGSTGLPKCIVETHGNIIEHVINSAEFNHYSNNDVSLNWIPIDHVVPIITYHFRDVILGCNQIHVATSFIVNQPLNWFRLIEHYAVSITWAPNFGYKLIINAAINESLDVFKLRSMRYFMNAGEQVTATVARDFTKLLNIIGVPASVMQPSFGMAEVATCMTYNNQFNLDTSIVNVKKTSFQQKLIPSSNEYDCFEFVDLGCPIPGCEIRIVNTEEAVEPELKVGMLQIRGRILANGYYNNFKANEVFHTDGWFSTGDLGFIYKSRLFITGREKEVIIIRGQNFLCYEIEDIINKIDGVKATFAAATSFYNSVTGSEELIVFYVLDEHIKISHHRLVKKIITSISHVFNISPKFVIDVPQHVFPKTSSGKIQRTLLKQHFNNGDFDWKLNYLNKPDGLTLHVTQWVLKNIQSLDIGSWESCHFLVKNKLDFFKNTADKIEKKHILEITDLSEAINSSILIIPYLQEKFTHDVYGSKSMLYLTTLLSGIEISQHTIKQIVILTNKVFSTAPEDINYNYQMGWLPGFIKSIQKEKRLPRMIIIDFDSSDLLFNFSLLKQEVQSGLKDNWVAYRNNKRLVFSLKRYLYNVENYYHLFKIFQENEYYLIVGGSGGIGMLLAQHLVRKYKANIIITGRKAQLAPLSLESKIQYIKLDLNLEGSIENALAKYKKNIKGIIYLAGTMEQISANNLTELAIDDALTIKGKAIEELFEYFYQVNKQLKFIVFSSIASLVGSAEYSLYAASNSLCEQVCAYLQAKYPAAISIIAWPPWLSTGMAKAFNYQKMSETLAFEALEPNLAINYFEHLISLGINQVWIGLRPNSPWVLSLLNERKFIEHFQVRLPANIKGIKVSLLSQLNSINLTDQQHKPIHLGVLTTKKQPSLSLKEVKNVAELFLAQIWSKHLKLKQFDKALGFFEVGGDSLSALNIIMDVFDTFCVKISMKHLVEFKSFNELLKFITTSPHSLLPKKPAVTTQADNVFPLSMDQKRIFYLCQLGYNLAYNIYKVYKIKGNICLEQLKATITLLVEAFPVLQTRLISTDIMIEQTWGYFAIEDIFNHYQIEQEQQILTNIDQNIITPFDLFAKKPLFRVRLYSLNQSEHYLLFNFHHLICDEWSLRLFIATFSRFYNATNKNFASEIKNDYFINFIEYQSEMQYKPSLAFVKQIQAGADFFVRHRNVYSRFEQLNGGFIKKAWSKAHFLKLKEIAKINGVTPAILCHTVFTLALFSIFGKSDFNIGIPITYREDSQLKNVFGFLVNTSVIGNVLNEADSLQDYLQRIKKNYLAAHLDRHIPFSELLITCKQFNKTSATGQLFQIMFVYEDCLNDWSIKNLKFNEMMVHNQTAKFNLTGIIKFPKKNSPVLCLEYLKETINETTAKQILLLFDKILKRVIELPNLKVSLVNLIGHKIKLCDDIV